jgi:replicative DNA helicase
VASIVSNPSASGMETLSASLTGLRRLPHNVRAEAALLGTIFINNHTYDRVSDFLRSQHFALAQHGRIYEACSRLIERGHVADPVTLKGYFEQDESLDEIGGADYLLELASSAVAIINAADYGRLIHDQYLRRELISIGEDVVNRAYDAEIDETAIDQIEGAEQLLYDLAMHDSREGGFSDFGSSLHKALQVAERAHRRDGLLSGVPTGFRDVDEKLGGLQVSDLIILAGRPAMGKTALATNMAFWAAKAYRPATKDTAQEGAVVAFFSLEMSREQLATRILAEQTGISSDRIRRGMVADDRFPDLVKATVELERLPLFIDDSPGLTISAMRTRARRLQRQHPDLGLIVVDYLQLIGANGGGRNENRVQELSEITRGLKTLAKELNLPVIALSQLSRAVENREDKRPQLADLRESGSIEQDADVVMFIYREQYYLERAEPSQRPDETGEKFDQRHKQWLERCEKSHNLADVIIAKQRHGPIGNIRLVFNGELTRFADYDPRETSGEF